MPKNKTKQDTTSDSDSGPEDKNPPPSKKSKSGTEVKADTTENGEPYWTLEKLRQVRINTYRNQKFVDIREFYEKDGKHLPGKKGISLTSIQWKKLLEVADEVTKALEE